MDRGGVSFIPMPCSVPSKQGSEHMCSHLLLASCFSSNGSLKPILVVETSVSWHRGDQDRHREDQDAGIFGKAKGMRCKDVLEVLVWPTRELQPSLKKNPCSGAGGNRSFICVCPRFWGKGCLDSLLFLQLLGFLCLME